MLSINGMTININEYSSEFINKIKEELTVKPTSEYISEEVLKNMTYKLYTEIDNKLIIPPYYGIMKFGRKKEDYTHKLINIKFNGELRESQQKIVDICYKYIIKNGGGVLAIPCGEGKTVNAIKIACLLNVKTLVVVHKCQLMDQWINQIKKFTNAKIGIIKGSCIETTNKDIVLATIQTLCSREFDINTFKEFGFVIYDECHHVSSKQWSKTLSKTCTKYTLGLSATPYRTDGLIKVLYWYIGEIIYQKKIKINNQVIIKMINFCTPNDLFVEKLNYFNGKMKPNHTKMISNIIKIQERNEHIVEILSSLRKNPERNILVLSDRIDHLRNLKQMLEKKIPENELQDAGIYEYTGKIKRDLQIEAEQCGTILFATCKIADEGLDISRLNTIVLTTSKKNITQAVGRILRNILENGNIRPLVIDIWDKLSTFYNHGKIRKRNYIIGKYNIENYYIYDNKIVTNREYNKILELENKIENDYINMDYDKMVETESVNIKNENE